MTLAEARKLEKGTPVKWRDGGYWMHGTFRGVHKYTSFGTSTFEDLLNGNIDFTNGKEELRATVDYVWDNGRTYTTDVSIRALHLDEE